MDKRERERLIERVEIMKAVSSPVRLFALERLSNGKRCVSDLVKNAGVSISALSRHLTRMKNAGILNCERQGEKVYYSLRAEAVLLMHAAAESLLVGKTKRLGSLCRTKVKSVGKERRSTGGRNILKGRIL